MRAPRRLLGLTLGIGLALTVASPAWSSTPGTAYSWGWNNVGRTGLGVTAGNAPVLTLLASGPSSGSFTDVSAGTNHGCGLAPTGAAYCWGNNWYGQLGSPVVFPAPSPDSAATPIAVQGGRTFSEISAGNFVSCALDDTHNAFCWGNNTDGQLGIGTADDSTDIPTAVAGGRIYNTISAGIGFGFPSSTCAVAADDSAYCWGPNNSGRLGNITVEGSNVPVPVNDFTSATASNGLGSNTVQGAYAVGSTIYAATSGGLSISSNGGTNFTNKTTGDGLGSNDVQGAYAVGATIYAATSGGLSISSNSGTNFTNKTTGDGLGSNDVQGAYAVGSTIYAATSGGLSISSNSGTNFTNKTTGDGLGSNDVQGAYAVGSTIYAATSGGLSISTDSGTTFTNKTTANGLGDNDVRGVYADGATIYAATSGGGA